MERLLSCKFNFDTVCVELKFSDGAMIAIDTIAVENKKYQQTFLWVLCRPRVFTKKKNTRWCIALTKTPNLCYNNA